MDLTAQMKDADAILELFKTHQIKFDKKYTTISENSPSTITFKGVRSTTTQDKLSDLLTSLHALARKDIIGNTYIKFVSMKPKMTSTMTESRWDKFAAIVGEQLLGEKTAEKTIENTALQDDTL